MPLVDDEVIEVLLEIRDGMAEQLEALREIVANLERQARAGEAFAGLLAGDGEGCGRLGGDD